MCGRRTKRPSISYSPYVLFIDACLWPQIIAFCTFLNFDGENKA